ncbi:Carbonic anhydrase alpha-class protein [Dioscorea alata]|uniref:Carbonic anhydrase alpha-class protein n=1 Tax=Dioscorea alata TaxID=55571 RepID=A0ACB7UQ16_DIOAL|nr:Carbonic anhydrase alpha-class protein [Dioscorea alata]
MKNTTILYLFFLLFFFISCPPKTSSQEVEDEREFSYIEGSSNGPEHWGELHEEWKACGKGDMQSPIDLIHERLRVVPTLGRLKRSYKPSNATIKNRGHDIMLEWEGDAGSLWINGSEYLLKQCHWHAPSEHTVNGKRFALEVHMVHQRTDGKIAVVGIMYKIGRPDSFIKELEERINEVEVTREDEINVGVIDPRHVKIGSRKYYGYMGSLTTPPCTQGVTWTIVNKIRTASRAQLKLLRDAVHDDAKNNARPLQAINEREIKFYTPRYLGFHKHY